MLNRSVFIFLMTATAKRTRIVSNLVVGIADLYRRFLQLERNLWQQLLPCSVELLQVNPFLPRKSILIQYSSYQLVEEPTSQCCSSLAPPIRLLLQSFQISLSGLITTPLKVCEVSVSIILA